MKKNQEKTKKVAAAAKRRENPLFVERQSFAGLVEAIRKVHSESEAQAGRAINISLTVRNWLIGWHIRQYEQHGADRATYGEGLLDKLSERLISAGYRELTARYLRMCRQFASIYPKIWRSLTAKSPALFEMHETPKSDNSELYKPDRLLIERLSFTHLAELVAIDDPLKRAFYEVECMRGNWTVRQLKRQIATLYFERSGLSRDKKKLSAMIKAEPGKAGPKLAVRDPYVFEFLGLKPREVMGEADLEDALLDKLQEFLLELGHGFCFEARQKSFLIGDARGFVDLVFYHRILKCHVLVELKVDEFKHEHLGQLNTYVAWYRKNMMAAGDNPPVGILLCTRKDRVLVEYALAAVNNRLFVSKYQVELPAKKELQRFLHEQRREIGIVS